MMRVYFSDIFNVDPQLLEEYGAFNISLVTDLPLFIDPFLLFNSDNPDYIGLHEEIINYLRFLKDSASDQLEAGLIKRLYAFPEVEQTWLGFTTSGNKGRGLGVKFANALSENLYKIFGNFGNETVTRGSHLEKLCLVRPGVGRDTISDFTANLIKKYLAEFTQKFCEDNIDKKFLRKVSVNRAFFNYQTGTWGTRSYLLPVYKGEYVLLTPRDILTKDNTWINREDLIDQLLDVPDAIPDEQLRAQVNSYFKQLLSKKPTEKETKEAAIKTLIQYPILVDYFIKYKEDNGDQAVAVSIAKVHQSEDLYVGNFGALIKKVNELTVFYKIAGNTYAEALQRILYLKYVIENKGGYKLCYLNGQQIHKETDLHLMYRLTWFATPSDVSSEVNDGRGPADFKVSQGAGDKTIVEFKLAKNIKKNLKEQVAAYMQASDAKKSIMVIFFFSESERLKSEKVLKEIGLFSNENVILIDARKDNKPSGSRA